ncbi:MAG: putative transcriptional regulator, TetR family protein [Nocardioidaceae bacterium]|nr:putative transcriptional regulator, TetR family protein [Nocardioidaceae bacterium]
MTYPVGMTRPRSAAVSRATILDAARVRFGTDGFERTTIRKIAGDAGIDPALVMRYFGSKEGLFAAAAEFRVDLPDLAEVPRDQWAAVMLPVFFAVWEDDARFLPLLRAAATSEQAAATMRSVFAEQVVPSLTAVAVDRPEVRAALVGSQVLGLALARYVLRLPPLVELTREELVAWVGPVLTHYLAGEISG